MESTQSILRSEGQLKRGPAFSLRFSAQRLARFANRLPFGFSFFFEDPIPLARLFNRPEARVFPFSRGEQGRDVQLAAANSVHCRGGAVRDDGWGRPQRPPGAAGHNVRRISDSG
jgi:hypothetical protein